MKILLLGANGQVGWELQRSLAPLGLLEVCDRQRADLRQPEQLVTLIDRLQPNVIVNAAAYTAVDKAETDQVAAWQVNAESVAVMAAEARRHDALLVHYSTEYVFDGGKQDAFSENDPTSPLNVYGASKLGGEQRIQASGCRHLILRTSWVYAARGNNFAKTMLRLAAEREGLRVVADQVGAPTSAELIADVSALMIQRLMYDPVLAEQANGIYHLTAAGEISWHGYARFVIDGAAALGLQLKATGDMVLPIDTRDYPLPAARPLNSRLDTRKLQSTFGLALPHWQYHADRMLREIIPLEIVARAACAHLSGAPQTAPQAPTTAKVRHSFE